jgi:hypothetical protein
MSLYSVTCQLLVVFPAVFDQFSSQFSKEDNSVGFRVFKFLGVGALKVLKKLPLLQWDKGLHNS